MSLFASQRRGVPRPRFLSTQAKEWLGAIFCGIGLFLLVLLHVEFPHGIADLRNGHIVFSDAHQP